MSLIPEIYVLEWSRSQNHFHIHTLGDCVEHNFRALVESRTSGHMPDYMPIAYRTDHKFFATEEEFESLFNRLSTECSCPTDEPSLIIELSKFKYACRHLMGVSGCYGVFENGRPLYVGRSGNLFARVCQHFIKIEGRPLWVCSGDVRKTGKPTADLRSEIRIWVSEQYEMLEVGLIRTLRPTFNGTHNP